MGTFGPFETRPGDPGKRFPGGTVTYDARRPGDSSYRYLVKLVRRRAMTVDPATGDVVPDRRVEEQRELFAQQREMTRPRGAAAKADGTDGRPRHWVTVHEVGTTGEGAFAVFDCYDTTLQKLVEVRQEPLGAAELKHVAAAVLDGLAELRAFGSRGHGKLKPSNVFLGPGKRVTARPVLLSDLGPTRDATEPADLRAVGELLYLCVTREPFNPSDVAVADSPDWQRLGPAGPAWRDLCARLVHPVPSQRPTLADARALVAAVAAPRDRRWVRAAAAAALAVLLALGVTFAVWHSGNRARRLEYEVAHRRWASQLVNALRQPIVKSNESGAYGEELLRFTFTPSIEKVERDGATRVVPLNKSAVGDDVWQRLLARYAGRPDPLPDPQGITSVDPRQAARIRQLSAEVNQLRADVLGWPTLGRLTRRAEAFRRKGWTPLQAVCQRYYDRVAAPLHDLNPTKPDQADADVMPIAVVAVATFDQRVGRKMDEVVALLDRLDGLDAAVAKGTADPHVRGLATALCHDLAAVADCAATAEDRKAAAEKFKYNPDVFKWVVAEEVQTAAVERVLAGLNRALKGDVLEAAAKVESAVRRGEWYGQRYPSAVVANRPYLDQLNELVAWNGGYLSRDPRKQSQLAVQLDRLQAQLSSPELAAAVQGLKGGPYGRTPDGAPIVGAAVAAFEGRVKELAAIRAELTKLDGMKFPDAEQDIVAGLAELTGRLGKLDVDALQNRVRQTADSARKYEQGRAEAEGKAAAFQDARFERAALRGAADVWRAWLPKLRAGAAGGGTALFDAAAALLDAYLDEPAPPPPATGPAGGTPYALALQARLMKAVDAAWADIKADKLAAARSDGALLTAGGAVNPSVLQPARDAAVAEYRRRAAAVADVADAAGRVRDRLDRCERFAGPWLPDGSPLSAATRALAARVRDARPGADADAELVALLRQCEAYADFERIDAGVAGSPSALAPVDRAKLARAVQDPGSPPELRYNAWLVLGNAAAKRPVGAATWPATAEELEVERGVRRALAQSLASLARRLPDGTAWRAKRQDELRRTGLPTLRRYLEAAAHDRLAAEAAKVVREVAAPEVLSDFEVQESQLRDGLSGPLKIALALDALQASGAAAQPAVPGGQGDRSRRSAEALAVELEAAAKWQLSAADGTDFWFGRDDEAQRLRAKYDGMAKQLRGRLAGPPPTAPPPAAAQSDFKGAGLGAFGWAVVLGPNNTVTYRSPGTGGRKPVAITFAPLRDAAPSGQPQPYLATSELSIEMANAIMASASINKRPPDAWRRYMSLAAIQEGFDTDTDNEGRKGPRAWSWDPKSGELVPTDAWLAGNEFASHYPQVDGTRKNRLPAAAPGGNPSLSHPLHRLCPPQAVYLAALANARLPTETEWKAAYKAETESARGATPRWNLRDQTFNEQVAFMRPEVEIRKSVGYFYPDVASFVPAPLLPPDGDRAPAPGRAPPDGVLWFCPVDGGYGPPQDPGPAPGTIFKHLVGNVAEFVARAAPPSAADIRQDPGNASRWTRGAGRVAVMGASALSPPEYTLAGGERKVAAPDVAFDADGEVDGRGRSKVAYTDVGVRLAIDVAGGTAVAALPPPLDDWFKDWVRDASPWIPRP